LVSCPRRRVWSAEYIKWFCRHKITGMASFIQAGYINALIKISIEM